MGLLVFVSVWNGSFESMFAPRTIFKAILISFLYFFLWKPMDYVIKSGIKQIFGKEAEGKE